MMSNTLTRFPFVVIFTMGFSNGSLSGTHCFFLHHHIIVAFIVPLDLQRHGQNLDSTARVLEAIRFDLAMGFHSHTNIT